MCVCRSTEGAVLCKKGREKIILSSTEEQVEISHGELGKSGDPQTLPEQDVSL